ncbi:hypothetical protein EP331_00125 [bacterium]|nr:MAG: hypothetical protein EP331_00125 [bacterium]
MSQYAPIALFVYNRPNETKLVIEHLCKDDIARKSKIYVFSDGPKNKEDEGKVESVRDLIKHVFSDFDYELIENLDNKGLQDQIQNGIGYVFERHDSIIVLEDDLLLKDGGLIFLNEELVINSTNKTVFQISAFQFPVKAFQKFKTVLLPNISTWGWATWKDRWNLINNNELGDFVNLFEKNQWIKYKFNLFGGYPYSGLATKELKGLIQTWGIRYLIHVFLNKGVIVYPGSSYIENIGIGINATHTKEIGWQQVERVASENKKIKTGKNVTLNTLILSMFLKRSR